MKTDEAKEIYDKTNENVEKLSRIIIGTMNVSFHVLIWAPFLTTILNYTAEEDMGAESFEMPFPMR